MKKSLALGAALAVIATAGVAGVSSISEDGRSASGKTMYRVSCTNGQSYRIYWSDGQWWDGYGAQGGQSRSLNEQAAFLCR